MFAEIAELFACYYDNDVFGNSNELEDEILLQADCPGLAEVCLDLDPDRPSTTPTLPIADLAAITINDEGKWE